MKSTSLRWRLRWLMVGAIAAVLLPLGVLSFRVTLHEIEELSDGRLAQSAHTLQSMIRRTSLDALDAPESIRTSSGREPTTVPLGKHTFESEVAFQVIDRSGRVRLATTNFATLAAPTPGEPKFRDMQLGKHRWRTFTLVDPASGVTIRAGERYDSRRDILRALLLDHSLPLLLGLPLIALLTGWAVQRGLQPLDRLAGLLTRRAPGSREPVALEPMPLELRPVVEALNRQLERMEDALERERRFSADVAHELRTPLTTGLISVEGAMRTDNRADAELALGQAQQALVVLARRVEQLLVLARLESGATDHPRTEVDLVSLAMEVTEELAQVIAESEAELSLQLPELPVCVNGFAVGLAALMRNLVENALRHVGDNGHVELVVDRSESLAVIEVTDNGPGIPPERRAEVFARFHREANTRGDGYGLGLSIVQHVAELHEAKIELLDAKWGPGLCVHVSMPTAGPAAN